MLTMLLKYIRIQIQKLYYYTNGRVVSNFINQILDNKPITIYDDSQTRSICYIDDLIDRLLKLMKSDYHFPVNIGNNEEYTILQLANIICDEMKVNQKYVYCDLPEDDPLQRKPDITKANKILNYLNKKMKCLNVMCMKI